MRTFLRFARRRYDTAGTPDSDWLLLQYGTFAFDGPPMFVLDFTRQFEICDASGDHDHYVQVHCELCYAPDPELRALGSFNTWFFHDSGDDLDQWAEALGCQQAWGLLRHRSPVDLRVSAEDV